MREQDLRDEAARCRRLASTTTSRETAVVLRELAEECERQADELRGAVELSHAVSAE